MVLDNEALAQLGVGGIFALLIVREVMNYLKLFKKEPSSHEQDEQVKLLRELVRSTDRIVDRLEPLSIMNERSIRHSEALEALLKK